MAKIFYYLKKLDLQLTQLLDDPLDAGSLEAVIYRVGSLARQTTSTQPGKRALPDQTTYLSAWTRTKISS